MERSTGYANLGDQRIAYEIIGDGPIDFVINTGWLSPFDAEWDDPHARAFYQQLTRFARVIRFDRRGVGASDPIALDALPPWESLSDEIEAMMDAAGSEQAVVLAGANAGAGAALSGSSPWATGTPNTANTPSPISFSTRPPKASTCSRTAL